MSEEPWMALQQNEDELMRMSFCPITDASLRMPLVMRLLREPVRRRHLGSRLRRVTRTRSGAWVNRAKPHHHQRALRGDGGFGRGFEDNGGWRD
jgi:hypothetical protein